MPAAQDTEEPNEEEVPVPSNVDDVVKALNEVKEAAEKSARQAERMRKKLKARAARGQWDRIGEGLDQIRSKMDVSEALKRAEAHLAKAKSAVEEAAAGAANTVKGSSAVKAVVKGTEAGAKKGTRAKVETTSDPKGKAQTKPQAEIVPAKTASTRTTKTAKATRATSAAAHKGQDSQGAAVTETRARRPRTNAGSAPTRKTSAATQRPSTTRDKGKLN